MDFYVRLLILIDILPQLKQWDSSVPPAVRIVVSTRVACYRKSDTLSSKSWCPNLENVYRRVYVAGHAGFYNYRRTNREHSNLWKGAFARSCGKLALSPPNVRWFPHAFRVFSLAIEFSQETHQRRGQRPCVPKVVSCRQGSSPQKSRGQTCRQVPKQVSSDGLRADGWSCDVSSRSADSHAFGYCYPSPYATTRDWLVSPFLPTAYRTQAIRISCHQNRSEKVLLP